MNEVVEIGRELALGDQMAFGLTHVTNALTYLTRFDEAWDKTLEALDISTNNNDKLHLSEVLGNAVAFHFLREGDLDQLLVDMGPAFIPEATTLSATALKFMASPMGAMAAGMAAGMAEALLGEGDIGAAERAIEEARADAAKSGMRHLARDSADAMALEIAGFIGDANRRAAFLDAFLQRARASQT